MEKYFTIPVPVTVEQYIFIIHVKNWFNFFVLTVIQRVQEFLVTFFFLFCKHFLFIQTVSEWKDLQANLKVDIVYTEM
jgi:hypothetical protein